MTAVALAEHHVEGVALAGHSERAVVELLALNHLGARDLHTRPGVVDVAGVIPCINPHAAPVVGRDGRVFDIDRGGIGNEAMEDVFTLHHVAYLALIEPTCRQHRVVGEGQAHTASAVRAAGGGCGAVGGIDDDGIALAGGDVDGHAALIVA